ncbi:MAG: hypothetical protein ACOC44_14600 [Promethearchaeia archaeon]
MENKQQREVFCKKVKDGFFGEIYSKSSEKKVEYLISSLKNKLQDNVSLDNFKRQFFTAFIKGVISLIKNNELDHRDFDLETLKQKKAWKALAKVILYKRIKELKNCQVEKKGKKYYVEDLKDTYFGKYIMERLKFSLRRSVLNKREYGRIVKAIEKLGYEVPVVVQPTETEKFFSD